MTGTADRTPYSRQTTLLACLAAWLCGIATGVILGLAYRKDGAKAEAPGSGMTFTTVPEWAPPARPVPTPPENEWTWPMNVSYVRNDCPAFTLKEMKVTDGDQARTVAFKLRLTNDHPGTDCVIPADAIVLRDGDGNQYAHDAGDIRVAALGAKWATITFTVPPNLDLAQMVVPDARGQPQASDIDLVRPAYLRRQ